MTSISRSFLNACATALALAASAPAAGQDEPATAAERSRAPTFVLATSGLPESRAGDPMMWKSTPVLRDIDGDGDLDLAAHPRRGRGARLWLGDGAGRWTSASEGLEMTRSCGGGIDVGDLNADGRLDVAVADHCHGAFVYLSDSGGRWELVTRELNPAIAARVDLAKEGRNVFTGAEDLALGDVNEDGHLDLVVAASDSGGLSVYFGDGTGRGWTEATADGLPSGEEADEADSRRGGWANQVRVHDVDGDGHVDIVASYYAGPRVWRGDGKGRWAAYSSGLPTNATGGLLRGVDVGDIDEDGRLDLVFANWADGPQAFLQSEDGTWRSAPEVPQDVRGGAHAVALADLDGDGHLDLLVGGRRSSDATDFGVFLLKGDGKGSWMELRDTGLPASRLPTVYGIAVGDVNADGLPDVAVSSGGNLGQRLLRRARPRGAPAQPQAAPESLPLLQVWLARGQRDD